MTVLNQETKQAPTESELILQIRLRAQAVLESMCCAAKWTTGGSGRLSSRERKRVGGIYS